MMTTTHHHTATFKLLRAIGIGFAVSLFFGTIPFLDLLQLPEKGGALGWAVYTAAYLWAMLALLRFGKLNMDQPFSVLPDNSELAAEVRWQQFETHDVTAFTYRACVATRQGWRRLLCSTRRQTAFCTEVHYSRRLPCGATCWSAATQPMRTWVLL